MGTNSPEYMKAWKEKNPEKVKLNTKKYQSSNLEKRKIYREKYRDSGATINSQRKSRYGITSADFDRLLIAQDGLCAVCNEEFAESTPYIDHCHETGKVRGLVHMICNTMLGHAKDNPEVLERAAAYLRRFKGEIK